MRAELCECFGEQGSLALAKKKITGKSKFVAGNFSKVSRYQSPFVRIILRQEWEEQVLSPRCLGQTGPTGGWGPMDTYR